MPPRPVGAAAHPPFERRERPRGQLTSGAKLRFDHAHVGVGPEAFLAHERKLPDFLHAL